MTRDPEGTFTGEVPIRKKDKKERKQSVLRALADDQRNMVQFDRWEMGEMAR